METLKLFDSELKIMDIVWSKEPVPAREVAIIAADTLSWNKNTTYTILKKLIAKKALKRSEPNFICTALIKRDEVRKAETQNLIDKLYNGSKQAFFAAFIQDDVTDAEFEMLRKLIEKR